MLHVLIRWSIPLFALLVLGPLAGIMIVDYWILRKRELHVPDLYRTSGRYAGWNRAAILALVAGIAPNVPGFLKTAGAIPMTLDDALAGRPDFLDSIFVYSWFIGFAVSSVVYWALSKTRTLRS